MRFSRLSFVSVVLLFLAIGVAAHPDDEFCSRELDPLLCSELALLDAEAPAGETKFEIARTAGESFFLYLKLGIEHILPDGGDHLLFILALLLSTVLVSRLLLQVTVFTLAHSITLGLALMNLVYVDSRWVEILIASSIAFVAVENIFIQPKAIWRVPVIFLFGLLHGLGFAGALKELGIPDDHFIPALAGFNIGIELAQVGFALVCFGFLFPFMKRSWYQKFISYPLSILIAVVALYWAIDRAF